MDAIIEYIIINWPTLVIVLMVGIACLVVSRKFTQWEDRHNKLHDELERRIHNSDCRQCKNDMHDIQKEVKEIKQDIAAIKSFLMADTEK